MERGLQRIPYTLPTETPTEFVSKAQPCRVYSVDKRFKALIIMDQKAS